MERLLLVQPPRNPIHGLYMDQEKLSIIPLIFVVPAATSICVIIARLLRPFARRRPRWTKPFVQELSAQQEGLVAHPRKRHRRSAIALLFVSITGLALQIVIVFYPVLKIAEVLPALSWATIALLTVTDRPSTAPIGLLAIVAGLFATQLTRLIGVCIALRTQDAILVLDSFAALCAIGIILRMPVRDPDLPSHQIGSAFEPPSHQLRSPEDSLTLWQFMTVSWMSPLISAGATRQLDEEDVWSLSFEFQHSLLHDKFRQLKGSVVRRLLVANGLDLVFTSILGIIELFSNFTVPVLLQRLLRSMQNPHAPRSHAVTFAVLSLLFRLIASQAGVLNLWYSRRAYERSRGEMVTMVYAKTLSRKIVGATSQLPAAGCRPEDVADLIPDTKQSKTSLKVLWTRLHGAMRRLFHSDQVLEEVRQPASMGKILNLMRNDVYEVAQRFWEFHTLVTKPLGLILSVVLIWRLMGWPCLIGVLAVVVAQAVNALITRVLLRRERIRRKATDNKLQKITQYIEAIRHLRWYGWQDFWQAEIMEARQLELNLRVVTGIWRLLISFTNAFASGLFPVAAFYAYTVWADQPLRIDVAFPALQLFSMLESNLREIPQLITVLLNAKVAIGRIEDFMSESDKGETTTQSNSQEAAEPNSEATSFYQPTGTQGPQASQLTTAASSAVAEPTVGSDTKSFRPAKFTDGPRSYHLVLQNASFVWPGTSNAVLHNISLAFPVGLNVICGKVAAGKTALLQAMLGELDKRDGQVIRSDEMIGYCAQTPWLQSMSIRDNILFSSPLDESRYKQVLKACALSPDLATLKHGDLSNIGENGIGLSGGQKARVALARAVYSRANILLLDDPLSALDHQTAEAVVRNCFGGPLLEGRTVVLVTHRIDLCQGVARQMLEISEGRAHVLDSEATTVSSDLCKIQSNESAVSDSQKRNNEQKMAAVPEKFVEDEHRAYGGVRTAVYWEYIKAGKLKWWAVFVCLLALWRLTFLGETWFLKQWGEAYSRPLKMAISGLFDKLPSPETNIRPWLLGFLLLAIIRSTMFLVSQGFMLVIVYSAGRQMFQEIMDRVSHATFRFYDVTPVGRLMNRMTSDIGTIDGVISSQFQAVAWLLITWASSLVVIASVTPVFLIFSLVLTAAFVLIFLQFLPTSQSLRRLEMVSLSPLMSNFGALLNGLTTVRAFRAQSSFQDRVIAVTDSFQKMDHFYWSLQAWLLYRFHALSACSTLLLTLLALYTDVSPGLTAFVLIAASQFVESTHGLCKQYGQLQMDFVSVERVVELLHLDQESPGTIDPPASWPTYTGDIVFDNVTMRYAPHLNPSLSGISCRIPGGSTTALLGRTGSGKSTLALALLATILPSSGTITLDNVDIFTVNKQALRNRVTFLAQDPILFSGSMRQNLDPLNEYTDYACDAVVHRICGTYQWTLETQVEAGGRNLSQGQRQLVGLARAVLRRSAIVILDEATASIDMKTAMYIQQVLREEMRESTVITIAHRLEAVKDADYLIRLDKGRVVEQGPAPGELPMGAASAFETDHGAE